MKRRKINKIALMLATASLTAVFGGALLAGGASTVSADEASTYELSTIFSGSSATMDSDNGDTAFAFSNGGTIRWKRDLAYKWQAGASDAKYLTLKFALKDTNFEKVTFTFETPSAWATTENKATNVVQFKKAQDGYVVAVNGKDAMTVATANISDERTLSLSQSVGAEDGEFTVNLTGATVTDAEACKFVNVGANYASYSFDKMHPLTISAEIPANATDDNKKTTVLLKEVNGQSFALNSDKKIVDNSAPVLVVNENVDGFMLGSQFSLDYAIVDVLKKTSDIASADKKLKYYQYTPTNTEVPADDDYKTLDSSVYFTETVYTHSVLGQTTVYEQENAEFISVKTKLSDGYNKADVDLAWYANRTVEKDGVTYIPVDRNEAGAYYTFVTANESTGKNDFDETAYENADATKAFKKALAEEAGSVSSGSNGKVNIPSLKWFINDNNGYRNLKFTLSYKTPQSETPATTSASSYNVLKLSVPEEGTYQFKVFATDKADNPMKYYNEDGELVNVTANNIWEIEEIPYFTFTVQNKGLSIDEKEDKVSQRKDSVLLNKKYTLADIDVTGADNLGEAYALYKVDINAYNKTAEAGKKIAQSALSNVSYADMLAEVNEFKKSGNAYYADYQTAKANGDYFDLYLTAYAKLLAQQIGADATDAQVVSAIKACFTAVKEYDSRITEENAKEEWEAYNKYQWSSETQSFSTKEEGSYLILADYYEQLLPSVRVTGYKLVTVASEADVIKGESDWFKNNVASVILFSIAGVILVIIIVMLLVKPSDETLEDVDEKTSKKEDKNKEE